MSLRLRVINRADVPALLAMINEPEVAHGLFADGRPQGMFYLQPPLASDVGPVYVFQDPEGGRPLGGGRIEADGFSYFVSRPFWGLGCGYQLARLMLAETVSMRDLGAPGGRITLIISRNNRASIHIAEQLGFAFAGASSAGPALLKYSKEAA